MARIVKFTPKIAYSAKFWSTQYRSWKSIILSYLLHSSYSLDPSRVIEVFSRCSGFFVSVTINFQAMGIFKKTPEVAVSQSVVGRNNAQKKQGLLGMLANPYVFMTCFFASLGCMMYGYGSYYNPFSFETI